MTTFALGDYTFDTADFLRDFGPGETVVVNDQRVPRYVGLHYAGALAVQGIGASYAASSATALTVGAGVHDLTITGGSLLTAGCWVEVYSGADPDVAMVGQVTAADPAAGTLQVTVPGDGVSGSGEYSDWRIRLSGRRGIQGPQGETGDQGPQGEIGGRWWAVVGTPSAALGTDGDMALDASGGAEHGTVWVKDDGTWTAAGNIAGPPDTPLSDSAPAALAETAAVGTGTAAARADHVHPLPSAAAVGAVPASAVGAASGVAALGADGQIIASQIPDNLGDVALVSANIAGDVTVGGNLTVAGDTFSVEAQTVQVTDHLMVLNYGEVGVGVTADAAGLEIARGTLTAYRLTFRESDDTVVLGEAGDEQAVATREDSPTRGGIGYWNVGARRFETSAALTFADAVLSLPSRVHYTQASYTETDHGEADAAVTLALTEGEVQHLTLTADTVVTLPDPPAGRGYTVTLHLIQDATGGRTPTLQDSSGKAARWPYDIPAPWQTGAGARDVVVLMHGTAGLLAAHAGGWAA